MHRNTSNRTFKDLIERPNCRDWSVSELKRSSESAQGFPLLSIRHLRTLYPHSHLGPPSGIFIESCFGVRTFGENIPKCNPVSLRGPSEE